MKKVLFFLFTLIVYYFPSIAQTLDPTFGSGGIASLNSLGFGNDYNSNSKILLPDGKILITGSKNSDFAVARLNSNGTLDPTFGTGGIAILDISTYYAHAFAVVVQNDGKIVLGGYQYDWYTSNCRRECSGGWGGSCWTECDYYYNYDFVIARLNPNGSVDNTFSGDGKQVFSFLNYDLYGNSVQELIRTLAIQEDGKIIAAGRQGSQTIIFRFNQDGSLDNTFNSTGIRTYNVYNYDYNKLHVKTSGKIVFSTQNILLQINPDSNLDASFGSNGIFYVGFTTHDVKLRSDDKLIAAGYIYNSSIGKQVYQVMLFDDNGSVDNSFGSNGTAIIDFDNGNALAGDARDIGFSVAVDAEDNAYVGGYVYRGTQGSWDIGIAKLNKDGSLASGFGTNGLFIFGDALEDYYGVIQLQPDNKIIGYNYAKNNLFRLMPQETTLSCPSNKIVSTQAGSCVTVVNNIDPVVSPSGTTVAYKLEKGGETLETGIGSVSGKTFSKGLTTVTYTLASDETKTCQFTVIVNDETPPAIQTCPAPAQLGSIKRGTDASGCYYTINGTEFDVVAADACDNTLTYSYTLTGETETEAPVEATTLNGIKLNKGTTSILWTITDDAGNESTCSFTVLVEDDDAPVPDFTNLPSVTGECSASVSAAPTATDKCMGTITATTEDPTSYTAQGIYTITWTFDDGNGNISTQTQQVIVDDVTKPVLDVATLPDLMDECAITVSALPTALDNCKGAITATTTDPLTYTEQGSYTITWSYDDGHGNIATQQQKVIIKDETDPTFSCPAPQNVALDASCSFRVPNLVSGLSGSDNCGGTVTFTQYPTAGTLISSSHNATHNVKITADDGNGNTSECTVVLTAKDGIDPTFVAPINRNVALSSNCSFAVPDLITGLVGEDNCGTVTFSQLPVAGTVVNAVHNGTYTVNIIANDGNGNTTQKGVVLTAKDQTAPVLTLPADLTISCEASTLPTHTGSATAEDNCDTDPDVTYTDVSSKGSNPALADHYNYTITRTWKAVDAAGNAVEDDQVITVQDVTDPTAKTKDIPTLYLGLSGEVSITAGDIDDGSFDNCSPVSLSIDRNSFGTDDVGDNTVTLTVTDVSGNSSEKTAKVTVKKRPTTLVYTGDVVEQYSDQQVLSATLTDQLTGTPLADKLISFALGSQSASDNTDAAGVATNNLVLTQNPALNYTVDASFAGDAIFEAGSDSKVFDITQENARTYYTGTFYTATSGVTSGKATITLSATIRDITAENGDLQHDAFQGDITKATVTFVNRDNGAILAENVPVGLVSLDDTKVGTAAIQKTVDIGSSLSETYHIGIIVNGYYAQNSSLENTEVTITRPGTEFISGGGYTLLEKPSGQKAGDVGSKNNFGFFVKYNKKGTNLQGHINTIIRRTEKNPVTGLDEVRVYQVKGNVMTSLTVKDYSTSRPPYKTAVFNGKASIQDVTNPNVAPIPVDGGALLQVAMTDKGDPGTWVKTDRSTWDQVSVTVWGKNGELWFASNWNGTKTVEQPVDGGNVTISSGNYSTGTTSSTVTQAKIALTGTEESVSEKLTVTALPNPSTSYFTVVTASSKTQELDIRVMDAAGRIIASQSNVAANGTLRMGEQFRPGVYFVEIMQGKEKVVVRLVKKAD